MSNCGGWESRSKLIFSDCIEYTNSSLHYVILLSMTALYSLMHSLIKWSVQNYVIWNTICVSSRFPRAPQSEEQWEAVWKWLVCLIWCTVVLVILLPNTRRFILCGGLCSLLLSRFPVLNICWIAFTPIPFSLHLKWLRKLKLCYAAVSRGGSLTLAGTQLE